MDRQHLHDTADEQSFSFSQDEEAGFGQNFPSDDESATAQLHDGTPNPSFYSNHGSYGQSSQWPQSYRQSIDIYSNITSPSLSIFSPGLQHFGSSYLSSSFLKHRKSTVIAEDIKVPLIPPEAEKYEISNLDKLPSIANIDTYDPQPKCSSTQGVLNGINVLCGVGILSTPFALKQGGWLGLIILFTFAAASWYTGLLLRSCLDSEEGLETYPDIGQAAFGTIGRLVISIILYAELYASCVEFLILEGDNLSTLFPGTVLSYNGITLGSKEIFAIMTALFVLPTVWVRDLSLLSYVSAGGVIASIVVVVCVSWVAVIDGVGFHHKGHVLNLTKLPVSIGLYGFCYSGHGVFPNIYSSLKNRSRFPVVLIISFVICTTMYASMASMGFTMFGEATQSQITLSLPQEYMASKVALWTTVVNPFTKYALTITPVAMSLEELFPSSNYKKSYWFSMALRTGLVISTLCIALLVPFFAYVMALIGSLLSMLVCLVLPALCFLKIFGSRASILQKVLCVFIMAIGIVCAIVGTYSSLEGIIQSFNS